MNPIIARRRQSKQIISCTFGNPVAETRGFLIFGLSLAFQ
jgi:hypothetical protein